mmetsp:Transcript_65404/g.165733  ORF Transcript_65404/g.165733 Transcript_65404/m.165733 type:complete len:131 (+) Transcript_65404:1624-2016(+)
MDTRRAFELFPPYSRVRLCGLMVNTDLNGLTGIVAPPGLSQGQEVPGTLKIRLENGREVAARPGHLEMIKEDMERSRELRLQQVSEQILQESEGGVQGLRAAAAAAVAAAAAEAAANEAMAAMTAMTFRR